MSPNCSSLLLAGVEEALDRFPDLRDEEAVVAFSGGKDSISLAHALKQLGRRPRLRAIDMRYSPAWRGRIMSLADRLGLGVDVIEVDTLIKGENLDSSARDDLAVRRAFLDKADSTGLSITPCTNCYNCKIISLVYGDKQPAGLLLFAHHARDVVSSFLKSALMFEDRWKHGHKTFDRTRYRRSAMAMADELCLDDAPTLNRLERILTDGFAQTSEPPLERRALHRYDYRIGRPLFFVDEETNAETVRKLGIPAESSGCGHSATATTLTPREIVHREMIPRLVQTHRGRQSLLRMHDMVTESLKVDGTVISDVRTHRHLLLGAEYKGGPEQLADKL